MVVRVVMVMVDTIRDKNVLSIPHSDRRGFLASHHKRCGTKTKGKASFATTGFDKREDIDVYY